MICLNMKRKWLYIIFSCVFLGFLLFVVNIFTTERKKEKNTEFPVIYNVEYMEYKEEQLRMCVCATESIVDSGMRSSIESEASASDSLMRSARSARTRSS